MRRAHLIVFLLILCGHFVSAQSDASGLTDSRSETVSRSETMVYLEQSETLNYDEYRLPGAQVLKGNVRFRHEDAVMYCDSAYFYEKSNSLDAFGHVRMVQGDTLFGFGDVLFYNGNTKVARLRRHVRLVHRSTTLTTDSLNYDRANNIAYYYTGGTIADSLNVLTSIWGQYTPPTNQSVFRRDVRLTNPNFVLTADTLMYNTDTKIADLVGPTEIVYEEETTILSSNGWYNTDTEQSLLLDRSRVVHNDGKSMTGDSIFYDKHVGYGRVLGNMALVDSVQKVTLYGNYGEMYEQTDFSESHGFATDSALMVDWSEEDKYGYIHADTLFTEDIAYSYWAVDSVQIDTTYHRVRAHHRVRAYREDLQLVCDSMVYVGKDSVIYLYTLPICWSDSCQVSADSMRVYLKDGSVDYMQGLGNAIAIKQETDNYFNQMSGKEIWAYVREDELRQVDVNGNAETVFFPKEEDGSYIGMNTTQSSYVKMFLLDQQIDHVLFTTRTTGVLYPLDQIPPGKDRLSAFFWAVAERPMMPGDVFLHPASTPRGGSATISAVEESEQDKGPGGNQRSNKRKSSR